jgi:hypothetical protein
MPSKCVKLSGCWIGIGTEIEVDSSGNITSRELKLVKQIQKINENVYRVSEIYYFLNGAINYSSPNYLISIGKNKNDFISSDSFGPGIDFYDVEKKSMVYRYNLNGLTIDDTNPYSSLNGTFKLKKNE